MVRPTGFEPVTYGLEVCVLCSSYRFTYIHLHLLSIDFQSLNLYHTLTTIDLQIPNNTNFM